MANTNTLRRPQKPVQTFLGPVLEVAGQWGFYFFQPATNPAQFLWFAQPSRVDATLLRKKMGKQPSTFPLVEQGVLEGIKQAIQEALSHEDPEEEHIVASPIEGIDDEP